jgi:hypothetical protein
VGWEFGTKTHTMRLLAAWTAVVWAVVGAGAVTTDDDPVVTPALVQCNNNGAECGLCFRDVPSVLAFDLAGLQEAGRQIIEESIGGAMDRVVATLGCTTSSATQTVASLTVRDGRSPAPPHPSPAPPIPHPYRMQEGITEKEPYNTTLFAARGRLAWNAPAGATEPYLIGMGYCHPDANGGAGDCGFMGTVYENEQVSGVQGAWSVVGRRAVYGERGGGGVCGGGGCGGRDSGMQLHCAATIADGIPGLPAGQPVVVLHMQSPPGMSCMQGLCTECDAVVLATCSDPGSSPSMQRISSGEAMLVCNAAAGRVLNDRCDVCATFASQSSCNYQPCVSDSSCSGHGVCDIGSGACACNGTWAGFKCDQDAACMALGDCDTHATCTWSADRIDAYCACSVGWRGDGHTCKPYVGESVAAPREELEPGWIAAIALGSVIIVAGLAATWFCGRKYCVRRHPINAEPYSDISAARHEPLPA